MFENPYPLLGVVEKVIHWAIECDWKSVVFVENQTKNEPDKQYEEENDTAIVFDFSDCKHDFNISSLKQCLMSY